MLRQTVGGIVTEQIGSVMVGVTTIYYSTLVLVELGVSAVQTVGIILAWGIACLVRWGQLQSLIHASAKQGDIKALQDAADVVLGKVHRTDESQ
jgi:hypothetical protein